MYVACRSRLVRARSAHRGARVGVRGGLLHVAQWHPGIEGGRDERVPQCMRTYVRDDPGAAGDTADDSGGAVPVQPPPVGSEEHRPFGPLADSQADRPGGARRDRDGDDLAALAGDHQGTVAAFQAQLLDVSAGRLRHPQPVQRQQGEQRTIGRRPQPGGDQERAELIAVQGSRGGPLHFPQSETFAMPMPKISPPSDETRAAASRQPRRAAGRNNPRRESQDHPTAATAKPINRQRTGPGRAGCAPGAA